MHQSDFGRDLLGDPLATTAFTSQPRQAMSDDQAAGYLPHDVQQSSGFAPYNSSAGPRRIIRNWKWWVAVGAVSLLAMILAVAGVLMHTTDSGEINRLSNEVRAQQTMIAQSDQEIRDLTQASADAGAKAMACWEASQRLEEWWSDEDATGDQIYQISMDIVRLCAQ